MKKRFLQTDQVVSSNFQLFGDLLSSLDIHDAKDLFLAEYNSTSCVQSVSNANDAVKSLKKVSSPLTLNFSSKSNNTLIDYDSIVGSVVSTADRRLLSKVAYLVDDLDDVKKYSSSFSDTKFTSQINSLIICGINMPYFLDVVLNWAVKNNIRRIAFVDSSIDGLAKSCFLLDWSSVQKSLKDNQIKSNFFFDTDLSSALSKSVAWFSSESFYSAVNFYLFVDRISNQHLSSAHILVNDPNSYLSIIGKGFIEDNYNMYLNTVNALNNQGSLYSSKTSFPSLQVFLVASGPSLDDTIDEIKHLHNNKNVIIVCAGSSITSLLDAGIVPDFCVLVERNVSVYEKHRDSINHHQYFKKVRLIASTSVDPRIHKYYKSTHLYVRSSNTYASFFPSDSILTHTHPTSLNAALSFSLSLSPSSIVLFGCDFGSSSKSYTRQKNAHGKGSYKFTAAIKGNSGTMFSNTSLMRSKDQFNSLLQDTRNTQISIYNRSISSLHPLVENIDSLYLECILNSKKDLTSKVELSSNKVSSSQLSISPDFTELREFILSFTLAQYSNCYSGCSATILYGMLTESFYKTPEYRLIHPLFVSAALILSAIYDSADPFIDSSLKEVQHRLTSTVFLSIVDDSTQLFAQETKS